MSKKKGNKKKKKSTKRKSNQLTNSLANKLNEIDSETKSTKKPKRNFGEALALNTKNKRTLWSLFIFMFTLVFIGQLVMFNAKYNKMTDGLKKGEVSIVTSLQNKWTIVDKGITYWGDKPLSIRENNYTTDNDLIDKLAAEYKSGEYKITDNSHKLFIITGNYMDVPKTVVSKLLGFEDAKRYDVGQVLKESKSMFLLIYGIASFVILLLKSLLIVGIASFVGKLFAKIRKKKVYLPTSFYVSLHGFSYGLLLNFMVGLFIVIPIDLSIIVTFIVLFLFIENEKTSSELSEKKEKKEIEKNEKPEEFTTDLAKGEDTSTLSSVDEDSSKESLSKKDDTAANDSSLENTIQPTNSISEETGISSKENLQSLFEDAQELSDLMKSYVDSGKPLPVVYYKEPEEEIKYEDLAKMYKDYQNQTVQEKKNDFEEVNQLFESLAYKNEAMKNLDAELQELSSIESTNNIEEDNNTNE